MRFVYLGLNGVLLGTVIIQPFHIQLTIKVTNVANNGIFQHLFKDTSSDDALTTSGGDKNTSLLDNLLNGGNLITFIKTSSSYTTYYQLIHTVDNIRLSCYNNVHTTDSTVYARIEFLFSLACRCLACYNQ